MPAHTGSPFRDAWDFCRKRKRAVFVGVVAFGMLLAVNHAYVTGVLEKRAQPLLEKTGIDSATFRRQIADQWEGSDPAKLDAMIASLRESLQTGKPPEETGFRPTPDNAGLYFIVTSAPIVFASTIVSIVIIAVSWLFFFLLALRDGVSAQDAARELPKAILPMMGLSLWVMLRSLVWLPIVGIVFGAYFLPRLALSPSILLGERKGVFESAARSIDRTRGKWSAIMGAFLTLFCATVFSLWVASGLTALLAALSPKVGVLAWLLLLQLIVAFWAVFQVMLGRGLSR